MTDKPKLSLVIPTHRRPGSLSRLLASVARQKEAPAFEVIVVMNLPEDDTHLKVWQKSLPLQWAATGQLGVNRARNLGLEKASGQVALMLDDDTELGDPLLLQKHWDYHQAHPETDGLGGGYAFLPELSDMAYAYHTLAMTWMYRYRHSDGRCPYLIGGHASYKRRLIDEGFRFSDSILFGGSETEFNWRLHQAGKILVYDPLLLVNHHIEIGTRDLMRKAFLQAHHACKRKQSQGAPEPMLSQEESLASVRSREPDDRGDHWRVKLGWWLYERGAAYGWRSAKEKTKNDLAVRLFAKLAGARLK